MHSLRLLALAAEAEGLVLKQARNGLARQTVCKGAAAVLGLVGLALLQVALWYALAPMIGLVYDTLVLATLNLALAGIFLLVGRDRRDPLAEEATRTRNLLLRAAAESNPISQAVEAITLRTPASVVGGLLTEAVIGAIRRR